MAIPKTIRVPLQFEITTKNFSLLIEEYLHNRQYAHDYKESTIRPKRSLLLQVARWFEEYGVTDMEKVTNGMIDTYYAWYRQDHSLVSTNSSRRTLKTFLTWLREYKELSLRCYPGAITLAEEPEPLPRSIDHDTIMHVINSCEDPQDALMIRTKYFTGVRISELVNIKKEDLSGRGFTIIAKGGDERQIYAKKEVVDHLMEHAQEVASGPIFWVVNNYAGTRGKPVTVGTARVRMQKAFKKYGGIDMNPHDLRHSFAIRLLENGSDIVTIQHLLGHKHVTTTMIYLRIKDTALQANYEKFMF